MSSGDIKSRLLWFDVRTGDVDFWMFNLFLTFVAFYRASAVISPAGNIGSIPNFDRVIKPHSWLRGWSRITKFVFKMADGRHIAKCWKRYNWPINAPTWMKRGWSHPIMSPTCYPWCGCHGNGRCFCLATAHCTFSSFGRLEAERVNQFGWNLVYSHEIKY